MGSRWAADGQQMGSRWAVEPARTMINERWNIVKRAPIFVSLATVTSEVIALGHPEISLLKPRVVFEHSAHDARPRLLDHQISSALSLQPIHLVDDAEQHENSEQQQQQHSNSSSSSNRHSTNSCGMQHQ